MAEISSFDTFQDFLNFNSKEILKNYFGHYHFLRVIKSPKAHEVKLYDAFNVINEDESIMCVWTQGAYYIYGTKWNKEIISKALEKIEIHKLRNYTFLGQRQLIEDIFQAAEVGMDSRKNRIAYSCRNVKPFTSEIDGIVENASYQYMDQLILHGINYYKEEFDEKGSKTDDEVAQGVIQSIEKGTMYAIRTENTIHAILNVIDSDRDKPMIGSFYTAPNSRNRGFGYKLLHVVTKGLLDSGFEECGLLSNADNPYSNKIFLKIGYEPIYDLVIAFKEK